MILFVILTLVQHLLANAEECGVVNNLNTDFITGGGEANFLEWPWVASIFELGKIPKFPDNTTRVISFICGGSVVNSRTIVTAAHCFKSKASKPYKYVVYVRKPLLDVWGRNDPSTAKKVEKIIIHQDYIHSGYFDADLAIIVLKHEIKFDRLVKSVCLMPDNKMDINKGTVVGWGRTDEQYVSESLMMANLDIISMNKCIESDPGFSTIVTLNYFCAGVDLDDTMGVGPCNGDSGGGFFSQMTEGNVTRWTLRGVISHSLTLKDRDDCLDQKYYIFTDLSKYTEWMRETIRDNVETSIQQSQEEVAPTLATNASDVTSEVALSSPLSDIKFCELLVSRDQEMSQDIEKQQKQIEFLRNQQNYLQQQKKSLTSLLESEKNGLMESLKWWKTATAGTTKDATLRTAQHMTLSQHLREPARNEYGRKVTAGVFEYIAELEIEHSSQVLGWLEHHISLPVVKYLMSTGADVLAQGEARFYKGSILHHAARAGELQVVQFLVLEVGADLNLRDGDYWTPLHHASWQGKLNVVQFLLSQDCDVNARSNDGNSALNVAAANGHLEVVKLLISHKAKVNNKGKHGDTPLHKAAEYGRLSTVKYLVTETEANVHTTNHRGDTPLDAARRPYRDTAAVVEWLQNYMK